MASKMHTLGYEYEYGCCAPEKTDSGEKKKRIEYPCLYIRGKQIPEMTVDKDGFGMATIKFRVQGYRSPAEGEKSLELEVHEISESMPADGKATKSSKDAGDMLNAELENIGSESEDDSEEDDMEEKMD